MKNLSDYKPSPNPCAYESMCVVRRWVEKTLNWIIWKDKSQVESCRHEYYFIELFSILGPLIHYKHRKVWFHVSLLHLLRSGCESQGNMYQSLCFISPFCYILMVYAHTRVHTHTHTHTHTALLADFMGVFYFHNDFKNDFESRE